MDVPTVASKKGLDLVIDLNEYVVFETMGEAPSKLSLIFQYL